MKTARSMSGGALRRLLSRRNEIVVFEQNAQSRTMEANLEQAPITSVKLAEVVPTEEI